MKHEKISIKWKIYFYLLSFMAILLIVLWFFQTVYLDVFYKNIKKSELKSAKNNLLSVINDDDLDSAVSTIAKRYDICILITDSNGNKLYSAETSASCSIHKMRTDTIVKLYNECKQNGNELQISQKDFEDHMNMNDIGGNAPDFDELQTGNSSGYSDKKTEITDDEMIKNDDSHGKYSKLPNMPNELSTESLINVNVVTNSDGEEYVILLNSTITPVGATVHTLRIQLIYISFILVVLSLVIALLISRRVSKSIINVNKSAKELAKGDYDIEFNGKDYKEIAELSNTLNNTAKQLQKTDILQKELLANVSHDLRTPLTMITAYSEVMRDLPGENTPENVQVIIDEAKRLTNLVNDLLDMSKIQAGVTKLETKEYDLTQSIKTIIERHSKLLEPYGYNLEFQCDKDVIVKADEFKIYQVIYNLIGNAVNYTGENKKVIIRQIISEKNKSVRIEVIDSGAGIPKDELENVWERYYKIDKTHKRAVIGTGLGLSIVNNILKLHEAKYGVESEQGIGSTFWFELNYTEIMEGSH